LVLVIIVGSDDINLFWELLDLSDAILTVDNDCCCIRYNFSEDEDCESKSFNFGPENLVFLFGNKLNIAMEKA